MFKKVVKVMLIALILLGAVIATTNILETQLRGDFKVVKYWPNVPDCYGKGTSCIDMT